MNYAESMSYLNNQLLVAMPQMTDPNFARTVSLICQHDAEGALGLIINRPMTLNLGHILDHMDIQRHAQMLDNKAVFSGGPVQPERGFVLHPPGTDFESSMEVSTDLCLTSSRDVLTDLAVGDGPNQYLVALGYAGWGAGQLDAEIADNSWLTVPVDLDILFKVAVQDRWAAATQLLGVDVALLSTEVGHA